MNQEQEKKLETIVDHYKELLDSSPREEWTSVALDNTYAYAKGIGAYKILNYASIKKALNAEVTERLPREVRDISDILGFELKGVAKTGNLFTLDTDKGDLIVTADELFSSQLFRKCVLSSFAEYVKPITKDDWGTAMEVIASCIVVNKEDTSQKDIVIDALAQFLSDADDREFSFLKKGQPIIKDEKYIFRISDLIRLIKREFDSSIGRPIVQMTLKELGFVMERNNSIRYWQIDKERYDS